MLTFGESVIVALISAVVAFATSLVIRWLDKERPVWKVTTDGMTKSSGNGHPFYVILDVANIGNGAAYDVVLHGTIAPYGYDNEAAVLAPGESLSGLMYVPVHRHGPADRYGEPLPTYLSGHELQRLKLRIRYRKPPVYSIRWSRSFPLQRLFVRARNERNDQRERAQQLRTQLGQLKR